MPLAVERPSTPHGWGGSTAARWGAGPSAAGDVWGANAARGGWDDAGDGGRGDAAATGGGWADEAAGGLRDDPAGGWRGDPGGGWPEDDTGGWGPAARPSSSFVPPLSGPTHANRGDQWGRENAQENENLWNNRDNGFANRHLNGPSGFSPNSVTNPYPYPSGYAQAAYPPTGIGTPYASFRQPPPSVGAYQQPSWATSTTSSPLTQQSSPFGSKALLRRSRPHMPFSYSPASTLGRSPSGSGRSYNHGLPDRPSEWRRDFSMRKGIASLLPRTRQRSYSYGGSSSDYGPQSRQILHPFLHFTFGEPPVSYDLRLAPRTLVFRDIRRDIVASDLTRFTCEPPLQYMRLIHPRLPWYIDVHASNPTGVNLGDLFQAIWNCLRCSIQSADFWNDELSDLDRDKISHAWRKRCDGDPFEHGNGVRRVDFLRRHVVFEGLTRGRNGTWEMKTRKTV